MHPDVRDIMGDKATLLITELAKEIDFRDADLSEESTGCFSIIGQLPDCHEYPHERVDAIMEVDGLKTVAKWSQHAVYHQLRKKTGSVTRRYVGWGLMEIKSPA